MNLRKFSINRINDANSYMRPQAYIIAFLFIIINWLAVSLKQILFSVPDIIPDIISATDAVSIRVLKLTENFSLPILYKFFWLPALVTPLILPLRRTLVLQQLYAT